MLRKMLGGSAEERRIAIPGARGALDWFAPIGQPNRVGQLKRASGRRCDHVPCWAERERERERERSKGADVKGVTVDSVYHLS